MYRWSVIVLLISIIVGLAICHHGNGGHGSGNRYGGNNWNNRGGPTDNTWTPSSLDCSSDSNAKNNTYCDQFMESLLGMVIGLPADDTKNTVPKLKDVASSKGRQEPGSNSNAIQVCCFLLSFPSARENCCQQITKFCDGILGPNDVCVCPSGHEGSPPDDNGDDNYGPSNNYGRGGRRRRPYLRK